jgi:hypothetical protein
MRTTKPNKVNRFLFLGFMSLLLQACSMEASISDLIEKTFLEKSQLTGFVSSSTQNEVTARGYVIQSSSGDYSNKIEETTAGGYKVYVSVQGNIVSGTK